MHGRGPRLGRGALALLAVLAVLPWASIALGAGGPNTPEVTTGSALNVTKTGAELTATVNPGGVEVKTCEFKYGTEPGALSSSAECSPKPGLGSTPEAVSAAVAELKPNTTYYFDVDATNEEGTGEGTPVSFKTEPDAPVATTLPAGQIKLTSALLEGSVNPEGASVTNCEFKYGTEPKVLNSTASCTPEPGSGTEPVPVTAAVTGLTPHTTYYYELFAEGQGGPGHGEEEHFETLADELAVTTGQASEVTRQTAKLTGAVNPGSSPVTGCEFEYGTIKGDLKKAAPCSGALPGAGAGEVEVTAGLTELAPNTIYYFKLVAENEAGPSPVPAGEVAFKTSRNPPEVTTGEASGIGQTSATVSGTVDPKEEQLESCAVEYGPTSALGSSAPCPSGLATGTKTIVVTIQLTGLSPGTAYFYRVVATSAGGEEVGGTGTFTTAAPTPPPAPTPLPAPPTGPKGPEPAKPPVVSSLAESNSIFRVGRSSTAPGGRISRAAPTGTVFSFVLDQPAVVGVTFIREQSGHRIGKSCVVGRRGAGKPACVRSSVAMALGRRARSGLNRFLFTGRVRGKALRPGAYRAMFIAESLAGSSTPSTISFRVVAH